MTFSQAQEANPLMRRKQPVGIIHSGGKQTIYQCCLCGERHTAATQYKRAKHVRNFKDWHNSEKCQVH